MNIIHDIFPAVVSMTTIAPTQESQLTASNPATVLNARRLDRSRVIVTGDRIIVATDSPEGPLVVFNQLYDQATAQLSKNVSTDSTLTTIPGDSSSPIYVAYRKSEDCSCGSRLRGWRPFGRIDSVTSNRN
jgi:hypothetical protein